MTTFKERLLRAAVHAGAGTTQVAIADALDLSRQAVNKWFIGTAEPSAENLLDISKKWGVSADWLQSGEGDMLPSPAESLPAEERELLRDYRSATPQTRKLLRTVARAARKSVLFMVATIPPLMSPSNSEAAMRHNLFYAPIVSVIHIAFKWLQRLALRPNFAA